MSAGAAFGVVVIGRNEGERLVRCLQSLAQFGAPLVYVDSNSTDGSSEQAQRLGAHAVQLDLTQSFTAARARNLGVRTQARAEPPAWGLSGRALRSQGFR